MSLLLSLGPWVALLVVLVGCSAFFSSSESAIFSLPVGSAAPETGEESSAADGESGSAGDDSTGVDAGDDSAATLAATLVLVFGEIVPKSYGLGHARTWSLRVAHPIALVERLLGGDADIEETYTE